MTEARKDLITERWHLNSLFRFELNAPTEFVALIVYVAAKPRHADVALRPSVNVVFSLEKEKRKKGARGKEARRGKVK